MDYYNSSKYIKAKNNFILLSIAFPIIMLGAIVYYHEGCASGLNCKTGFIAALLFGAIYLYSIFILLTNTVEKDT